MMPNLDESYAFRESLVRTLASDLIGPSSEYETILDAPLDAYVTGILYPQGDDADAAQDDGEDAESGGDQSSAADPPVAMANVQNPSALGITFAVDTTRFGTEPPSISVSIHAARYEPSGRDEGERRRGRVGAGSITWTRIPIHGLGTIGLTSSEPGAYAGVRDPSGELIDGLDLYVRIRDTDETGVRAITLALVNTLRRPRGASLRDEFAFFQTEIRVHANAAPVFVERRPRIATVDEEQKSSALLYRHTRTFAIGHGCSADWVTQDDSPAVGAISVGTTFVPTHELPLADSNNDLTASSLSMLWATEAPKDQVIHDLDAFCIEYDDWIKKRVAEVALLGEEHRLTAYTHLERCTEAVCRMQSGVRLLSSDADVWRAWRLMNEAMLEQRSRSEWLSHDKPTAAPERLSHHAWRPFQLGFLLLCIQGIARPRSDDRRVTDLLWFPTGGGKTEAYLGLIAFTLFLRRISCRGVGSDGSGVTALMRYTLRLLTSQQFQRAALLICACEEIRRNASAELGTTPISIGLWVGQGATPNVHYGSKSRPGTRESLDDLRLKRELTKRNPVQLSACPWCGLPLDARNYWLAKSPHVKLVIQCRDPECEFKDGLPVWVVDEDIYRERPTLLIATLDKFAALPWQTTVFNLFNRDTLEGPPDLIVQDELHLIAGPLGSLAGLYETAVSALATKDGVGPKIIASTATIRRAEQQGTGLFAQDTRQFPPPALDSRNSYFAVEAPRSERGSRLYVGLMAPGKSQTTLLIRVYAALLQNAATLPVATEAVRDVYWTLLGYFNSLRVLSGARLAVQDDVTERIDRIAAGAEQSPRGIDMRIEVTSRESQSKIPQFLKDMTIAFPSESALDVILATNMISVGVDIDRLGLMVVMGQPQGTSEYIQATSRVGRRSPGLIVTLLNASRSRDRSHYEGFVGYHEALYKQVEATSVTPFSARARDRGLHAVIVALARYLVPEMQGNSDASKVRQFEERIREAVWPVIAARLLAVGASDPDQALSEFNLVLEAWKTRADDVAASGEVLGYYYYKGRDRSLLWDAGADLDDPGVLATEPFPTQRSLRDVDTTSHLDLVQ